MALEYIEPERVLQMNQSYVLEAAEVLGLDLTGVRFDNATDTCFEKAELLGWDPERVVRAVFVHQDGDLYGFISPELGQDRKPQYVNLKTILPELLGISKSQSRKFRKQYCPDGMEYGTCTPFVLDGSFEEGRLHDDQTLRKLFVHDILSLDEQIVDISSGGHGEMAHRNSLHLPYKGIHDILAYKFRDKVQKVDLFP